jgi:hypothetical protein
MNIMATPRWMQTVLTTPASGGGSKALSFGQRDVRGHQNTLCHEACGVTQSRTKRRNSAQILPMPQWLPTVLTMLKTPVRGGRSRTFGMCGEICVVTTGTRRVAKHAV